MPDYNLGSLAVAGPASRGNRRSGLRCRFVRAVADETASESRNAMSSQDQAGRQVGEDGSAEPAAKAGEKGGRTNYRRRKRARMHAEAEAEAVRFSEIRDHPMLVAADPQLVTDAAGLEETVAAIREAGSFAYDTEFIGEETFLPRICLVQVATPTHLALVDPASIPDLEPIFSLVADPEIETLVHDGAQDLEPVRRLLGVEPQGIVDTQVCAAFLDMPWPSSLAKVVDRFTGHTLTKGHTFTDWDARPLTPRQVRYAADDVRFLPLVWQRIRSGLEEIGRLEWAIRECDESRRRHVGRFDPEKQVRRIVKGSRTKPKTATILRSLVELRHEIAQELDLPHRVAIGDEALSELARAAPQDVEGVQACRHVGRRLSSEQGARIAAAIREALAGPMRPLESTRNRDETAEDRMRIDAIWSALSLRCLADHIAPSILTSRADLASWYLDRSAGRRSGPLFDPDSWRHDAAGRWLEDFLAGHERLELSWREGRLSRSDDRSSSA